MPGRVQGETDIIRCADLILASTRDEAGLLGSLYGADPDRIEVLPPGRRPPRSSPRATGRRPGPGSATRAGGCCCSWAGSSRSRVSTWPCRRWPRSTTPSCGRWAARAAPTGPAELERVQKLAADLGVAERLLILPPRPHHELVDYYRAADVCLVPSRTESFGLVALEAAACGTPVVAASVGGLRRS